MKNFYTALMTKFNSTTGGSHNSFYTAIGGRLYQGMAPDLVTYPYGVFTHVVNTQDDMFGKKIDDVVLQLSIFSKSSSSVEVHDAMTYAKAFLDDCAFTITGSTLICFYRLNDGLEKEELVTTPGTQTIWHFHVDYMAILERN